MYVFIGLACLPTFDILIWGHFVGISDAAPNGVKGQHPGRGTGGSDP